MELRRGTSRRGTQARVSPRTMGSVAAVVVVLVLGSGCRDDGSDRGTGSSAVSSTEPSVEEVSTGALVIAHRGASGDAPEHTFAAYDLAIEQGADYLEQDLQLTADGVLVVLHDATLDRTARGPAASCTGAVADKTLAQLEQCEVGSWFNETHPELADPAYVGLRIPTMEQVLDRYGDGVRYYIELKALEAGSGVEEQLVDLLARAGLLDLATTERPVIVQSFGPDVLRRIHALRPELPLVQLLFTTASPEATLDRAREYAVAIGPPSAGVDRALVEAAHGRCLEVHPYTVDDPGEMARLLDAGVDGLFTNEPAVLRGLVEGLPPPPLPCAPSKSE